jgi:hypothetical protein
MRPAAVALQLATLLVASSAIVAAGAGLFAIGLLGLRL